MSKDRPYEFVPTYALAVLISEYERLVKAGFFKLQPDLDKMQSELNNRFLIPQQDKQISIEEYMRSRKNEIQKK